MFKLVQILTRINESFAVSISNILSINPYQLGVGTCKSLGKTTGKTTACMTLLLLTFQSERKLITKTFILVPSQPAPGNAII